MVFSQVVKDEFFDTFHNVMIIDSIGSSEIGGGGILMASRGQTMKGGPTVKPGQGATVLDMDTLEALKPGSKKEGVVARTGFIPLGYYNDAVKTAETFVTAADGKRYALSGDSAIFETDGTITMLGRGSQCINSGGEKIFSEEVDSAVKGHPDILDVTVIGVPDERWGAAVCALVELRKSAVLPSLEDIQDHCRKTIAGYKVPRHVLQVAKVIRSPSGKPDYQWAKTTAFKQLNLSEK